MYVEAFKEAHVMEAVRGLRNVLISKGAKLVPLGEMVQAITVNTKAKKVIGMELCSGEIRTLKKHHTSSTCLILMQRFASSLIFVKRLFGARQALWLQMWTAGCA